MMLALRVAIAPWRFMTLFGSGCRFGLETGALHIKRRGHSQTLETLNQGVVAATVGREQSKS